MKTDRILEPLKAMYKRLANLFCRHDSAQQTMLEEVRFDADGRARWAGMGDLQLISPDGKHHVEIRYAGEPPHGDSYHRVVVDGRVFPGFAWGCMFAFSSCSRYVAFSWMSRMFERHTVVADMSEAQYAVLPEYIYDFTFQWPKLLGEGRQSEESYTFNGSEAWQPY